MRFRLLALFLLAAFAPATPAADRLVVAVDSAAADAVRDVAAIFTRKTGVVVTIDEGASASLATRIRTGSDDDLFLSADMKLPTSLEAEGLADGAVVEFARGRLVVWTKTDGLPIADWQQQARSPRVQHIALANADVSPYGRESERAIAALGLAARLADKLVRVGDLTAVDRQVLDGKVELAITARSSVMSPATRSVGAWVELPQDSYEMLSHGAVVLRHGREHAPEAAQKFLEFLQDPTARDILRRQGFDLP